MKTLSKFYRNLIWILSPAGTLNMVISRNNPYESKLTCEGFDAINGTPDVPKIMTTFSTSWQASGGTLRKAWAQECGRAFSFE